MQPKTKKVFGIIGTVFTWLVVAFAVFMMIFTLITVNTVDKNEKDLLGTKFYIVRTDSMSKSSKNANMSVHFNAGDIILVKNVSNPSSLKAGNIISFMSTNSDSYGETITHMIREVKKDSNGKVLGYVTYGTSTGVNDEALVEPEYVLGIYSGKLPGMGKFFMFLKTTPGYILCVLVPFVLVIGYNVVNCIAIFVRYKKEQLAEVQAERDQLVAEKMEADEMRRQLEALQAQLAVQNGGTDATQSSTPVVSEETSDEQTETGV